VLDVPQFGGCGDETGEVRNQHAEATRAGKAECAEEGDGDAERLSGRQGPWRFRKPRGRAVEVIGGTAQVLPGCAEDYTRSDSQCVRGRLGGCLRIGFDLVGARGGEADDIGPQGTPFGWIEWRPGPCGAPRPAAV
jgi:hypothetical protein